MTTSRDSQGRSAGWGGGASTGGFITTFTGTAVVLTLAMSGYFWE